MKIGEIAKRAGCPVETVRYYEREGLLAAPARSEGNYRVYRTADLERLTFIRHCRSLDMTLEEIGTLLTFWDNPEKYCTDVNALLDGHIGHVTDRVAELRVLKRQLVELRRMCRKSQRARDCGILRQLSKGSARGRGGAGAVHTGRRGT